MGRVGTKLRRGLAAPLEDKEQEWLAEYLDLLGLLWWHTPNGGHRNIVVASKLAGQGVKAGVPDVTIMTRPPKRPDARGVFIELKRQRGSTTSAAQKAMIARLEAEGGLCYIAKGWADAREWLQRECGWGR